jgi:molybdate transport system permease protein
MAVSIDISLLGAGLRMAALSTLVSVVLGLWLAWLLVNHRFPGRRELSALSTAALALPAPVICYFIFSERNPSLWWGLTGAAVLAGTPMLVRAGRLAFTSLDAVYGNVARSLGRSDWRIFWRVEFPLVWRPTLAAAGVVFARVFAEFAAALLIAARLGR